MVMEFKECKTSVMKVGNKLISPTIACVKKPEGLVIGAIMVKVGEVVYPLIGNMTDVHIPAYVDESILPWNPNTIPCAHMYLSGNPNELNRSITGFGNPKGISHWMIEKTVFDGAKNADGKAYLILSFGWGTYEPTKSGGGVTSFSESKYQIPLDAVTIDAPVPFVQTTLSNKPRFITQNALSWEELKAIEGHFRITVKVTQVIRLPRLYISGTELLPYNNSQSSVYIWFRVSASRYVQASIGQDRVDHIIFSSDNELHDHELGSIEINGLSGYHARMTLGGHVYDLDHVSDRDKVIENIPYSTLSNPNNTNSLEILSV